MRRPTPPSSPDGPPVARSADSRALSTLVLGCLLVGASSTFIKLSGATADTAAFLRCALALVPFAPLMLLEWRRFARPPARMVRFGLAAGVLLGADYLMWTQSILDAGAGVATVLIGVQVVVFPLLARVLDGEHLTRRFLVALPVMIAGLGLTGGLLAADPTAPHPLRGAVLGTAAGVCYAGFLYLVRPASDADRRLIVTPTGLATASAAVVVGVVGVLKGGIDLDLEPQGWLWLAAVALGGQALSFVLIGYGSVRLPAGRAAAVMLLQPVAAVVLGTLLLGEQPAGSQYVGMALTVAAIAVATTPGRRP
ncbi:DMT family transporter [Isoptericola cucumis]|uniref:DMT family transporter n=1 Tax=Isoptericola cucumis TaxID=1776856 RepID=UPI0016672885|nr:DMT family transporter [Isoptericola cucumis]